MRITKKLALEIFTGDFSNIDFNQLTFDNKGRVNRFDSFTDIENIYKKSLDLPILKKDFDGLVSMRIIKTPNEDYKRSKYHLQTDVFRLEKIPNGYYLTIYRDNSIDYKDHLEFNFTNKTRNDIVYRLLKRMKTRIL